MFNWMLPAKHAIAILKNDHDTVKELFDEFEKAEGSAAKEKIIAKAVMELKIHATIEEEIFYPKVRAHVGGDILRILAEGTDIDDRIVRVAVDVGDREKDPVHAQRPRIPRCDLAFVSSGLRVARGGG